jgi:hypothetical protein
MGKKKMEKGNDHKEEKVTKSVKSSDQTVKSIFDSALLKAREIKEKYDISKSESFKFLIIQK